MKATALHEAAADLWWGRWGFWATMIACNESLSGCFNAPIHHQVWPSIQLFHKMIRPDHWFCNYKDESMQLIRFSGSTIHLPKIEYVFIVFFTKFTNSY